jgi:hypothetical protein
MQHARTDSNPTTYPDVATYQPGPGLHRPHTFPSVSGTPQAAWQLSAVAVTFAGRPLAVSPLPQMRPRSPYRPTRLIMQFALGRITDNVRGTALSRPRLDASNCDRYILTYITYITCPVPNHRGPVVPLTLLCHTAVLLYYPGGSRKLGRSCGIRSLETRKAKPAAAAALPSPQAPPAALHQSHLKRL